MSSSENNAGAGPSKAEKRTLDSATQVPITPEKKEANRSSGHLSTPKKSRLTYDYWKDDEETEDKESDQKSPKQKAQTIEGLESGRVMNMPLRFRVTLKSSIKITTVGRVLNFQGMDATGQIAFVAFDREVDQAKEIVKVNKILQLTNFTVREASTQFPSGTGNRYEIYLTRNSKMEIPDDLDGIPPIPIQIVGLGDVCKLPVDSKTDAMGVLVKKWKLETTTGGYKKRDMMLTDSNRQNLLVTLWGAEAENFEEEPFCVVLIKGGLVSVFDQLISLSCTRNTLVWVNPDLPEAEELMEWFIKTPRLAKV